MLILVFVVSFGPKKGTLLSYATYWYTNSYLNFWLLLNTVTSATSLKEVLTFMRSDFQFTIITSRITTYVLFLFWCFFYFFGESLLLMTFNFNNLNDLIPSSFFTHLKTHMIFLTSNSNSYLTTTIMYYIVFFTASAILFLLNLKYSFNYNFFKHQFYIDLLFILVNIYLFNVYFILALYLISVLNKGLITR